ncbi:MAG: peptidyl-prolyl cis-trans isomerase [Gammaproteobacteria bacterium]|nr:MAG: peptidyl-prolyl cis-trans isomerase [Gammaproteobacteria bacterium]
MLLLALLLGISNPGLANDTETAHTRVVMETDQGIIVMQLFDEKAPKTVTQFLAYVDSGFYNGTIFHRAIPNFIIQGGGFTETLTEKPVASTIPNESRNRLSNKKWSVAMARTSDPDSAGSQFFINLANNVELNFSYSKPGYTVFAEILEGQDLLENASKSPRAERNGMDDVPEHPLTIIKAYREESAE